MMVDGYKEIDQAHQLNATNQLAGLRVSGCRDAGDIPDNLTAGIQVCGADRQVATTPVFASQVSDHLIVDVLLQ